MVQARQGNWAEKRRTYRARASATYMEQRADRAARREAQVRDHAVEAIDEAITRFRADLRATKKVVLADGTVTDEPIVRVTPRDLALVIDRLNILFGRPGSISEERSRSATLTAEPLPVDLLKEIVELTRGRADTRAPEASALPRWSSRPEG